MPLTLENHEDRLKALEAKVFPAAPFKLGYVANAGEVRLVKMIGATYARVQAWPGGAQKIVDDGAFSHGIEVAIRIAREYIPNTTSKALEPLTTDAQRNDMIGRVTADVSIYNAHGVNSYIFGNEPDGTRNGQPRYSTIKLDRFGTDWAQYIAPLPRWLGMRVGFGLPIFPSNDARFVGNLISSGAWKPGDFFAANIYGGTAEQHHAVKDQHIAAIRSVLPGFDAKDLEISEAGLKRGGGQDAWMIEIKRVIDIYRQEKYPAPVSIYRIDENSEAPFAPFKDGVETATFERWKQLAA